MFTNEQFTYLVKKYIDTVYRVALGYTKNPDDTEDITQDVFVTLFREKKPFETEEHIRYWLIRVTVNACKKWMRSPLRKQVPFEDYAAILSEVTEQENQLLQTVMALPVKYRIPIYLFYYEAYSTEEIARILRIPKGTVCTNLKRGRELLKELLREDGYG